MRHGFPARTRAIPILSAKTRRFGGQAGHFSRTGHRKQTVLYNVTGSRAGPGLVPPGSTYRLGLPPPCWPTAPGPLAETPHLAHVRHAARREGVGCGVVEFLSFPLVLASKPPRKNSTKTPHNCTNPDQPPGVSGRSDRPGTRKPHGIRPRCGVSWSFRGVYGTGAGGVYTCPLWLSQD